MHRDSPNLVTAIRGLTFTKSIMPAKRNQVSWRCALKRIYSGNWTDFRSLPLSIEIDFHNSDCRVQYHAPREASFSECMEQVQQRALESVRKAYERGLQYVIFTHGHSTSRRGRQSSRSKIRATMRSRDATPYIQRSESIHTAVRSWPGSATTRERRCPNPNARDAAAAKLTRSLGPGTSAAATEIAWASSTGSTWRPCPKNQSPHPEPLVDSASFVSLALTL